MTAIVDFFTRFPPKGEGREGLKIRAGKMPALRQTQPWSQYHVIPTVSWRTVSVI
jgi:hypothetical protein